MSRQIASTYDNPAIQSAIAGIVRPVSRQGIDSLEIRKGKKSINQVQKADIPIGANETTGSTEIASADVKRSSRETVLRLTRANFEKGKWGFFDGAANFNAEITDERFKAQLDAREIGFYKGDTLRVVLTVTQLVAPVTQAFHTTYEIEKVLAHEHAPKQQRLI